MNATDAVKLCRYVKAACPQQAMDEYTPQAWADLLVKVRFEDAQEAVRNLARRQPFVAPAEIIGEVHRIRRDRSAQGEHLLQPPPFTTVADYQAWLKKARGRVADGESPEEINADYTRGELLDRRPDLTLALAAGPAVRERKRETTNHEITQAEIDAAKAKIEAAIGGAA